MTDYLEQVRRLVATNFNGTIELDYPFITSLDATSLVQLSDMRGQMIFENNRCALSLIQSSTIYINNNSTSHYLYNNQN